MNLPFDIDLAPARYLQSGSFTCLYESGKIRYLRVEGKEIIRVIYTAVRDDHWNTAISEIIREDVQENAEGFSISYNAVHRYDSIVYESTTQIEARSNTLIFTFHGKAVADFQRNRIGICVLLPIAEREDQAVQIISPDGDSTEVFLPLSVSPHQPAKNIRRMEWKAGDQVTAALEFDGDIFEMEDQRNWSDNSYKVYSTPQDLPLPVMVKRGDEIAQQVKFSSQASEESIFFPAVPSNHFQSPIDVKDLTNLFPSPISTLKVSNDSKLPNDSSALPGQISMPAIGYCRLRNHQLTQIEIEKLRTIPFHCYRVELALKSPEWKAELNEALNEANLLGTRLELIALAGNDAERSLETLKQAILSNVDAIDSLLVVDAENGKPCTDSILKHFQDLRPAVRLGYGTNNHFADLNRNLPSFDGFDFLSFGVSPQAHVTDSRTIIENVGALPQVLKKLQAKYPGKNIHVSPVTLTPRENARPDSLYQYAPTDNRLHTHAFAFWTLAMLSNMSGAQATIYDAVGPSGVVQENTDSPLFKALQEIKSFNPVSIQNEPFNARPRISFFRATGEKLIFKTDEEFLSGVYGC